MEIEIFIVIPDITIWGGFKIKMKCAAVKSGNGVIMSVAASGLNIFTRGSNCLQSDLNS